MSTEAGWLVVIVAAFFGTVELENARRGLHLRPFALLRSAAAAYGVHWLLAIGSGGEASDLALLSLVFVALAPFIGYLWWGRHGAIRRFLIRLGLGVLVSGAAAVRFTESGLLPWCLGLIVFVPWRRGHRWFRNRRQQQRWLQQEAELQAESEAEQAAAEADEARQREVLEQVVAELRQ